MNTNTPRVARRLAARARRLRLADVPVEARRVAVRCVLDTIGVGLAGAATAVAREVARYACERGDPGAASCLGGGACGAEDAALVNGTCAHALDYDDTCYAGVVHASAVVLPAVLAVAEERRASGAAVLEAFIAGVETVYALGRLVGDAPYLGGAFPTALLGPAGAAAGATRILVAEAAVGAAQEMERAITIAACRSAGARVVLGTEAKPLMAGYAARVGVEAARLGAHPVVVPRDVFEGPNGLLHQWSMGDAGAAPGTVGDPHPERYGLQEPGIVFKRHPLCSSLLAAVEGLEAALGEHRLDAAGVDAVTVRLAPLAHRSLLLRAPRAAGEAPFSLPWALGCVLAHGRCDLAAVRAYAADDEAINRAMGKIRVGEPLNGERYDSCPEAARLDIQYGRRRITVTRSYATGDPRKPLDDEALERKFQETAGCVLGPGAVATLLDRIRNLERLPDVSALFAGLERG